MPLAAALALGLLVVLAVQPVLAISWGSAVRLTSNDSYRGELLRTGSTRAVAVWQRGDGVYLRRSGDSGATWTSTVKLASGINAWAAAATGRRVDVTYVRRVTTSTGGTAFRLYIRRSTDGGATWGTPKALTSSTSKVADTDVAHRADGEMVVVWTGLTSGNIYTRRSTDHGATFAAAEKVAETHNSEPGRTVIYRSDPRIAIGTDVIHVAYLSAADTISVRRSTNGGASWSSDKLLTRYGSPEFAIVASGSKAVVGYTSTATGTMKAIVRRTTDKGATWSASVTLASHPTGTFSAGPTFAYREGVLAVAFKRGTPGASPVYHRQSHDFGATWTDPTRVSQVHVEDPDPEPAGIAILDNGHLVGYAENRGDGNEGIWVRRSR